MTHPFSKKPPLRQAANRAGSRYPANAENAVCNHNISVSQKQLTAFMPMPRHYYDVYENTKSHHTRPSRLRRLPCCKSKRPKWVIKLEGSLKNQTFSLLQRGEHLTARVKIKFPHKTFSHNRKMPMELLNTALIVATFIITFWFGITQLKNAIRPAIKIAIVQSDEFSETVQIELCRMPQHYLFRKIITIHPTHCGILEYGVGQFSQRTQSYIKPPKSITLNCWINASFSTNESSLFWFTINKSSRKHGIELKFKHVEFPYYVSIQIPMPQNNEFTA